MIDISEYPLNYDFLSEEEKTAILEHANGTLKIIRNENLSELMRDTVRRNLIGFLSVCEIDGIKVVYDWFGHPNQFSLATMQDADMQQDWYFQCADY